MSVRNNLRSLIQQDVISPLTRRPDDSQFEVFLKVGIQYGLKFVVQNINEISQYRGVTLVDFSNVVRNMMFLSWLQYFGITDENGDGIDKYLEFKRIIPYSAFDAVLPMVTEFLSYWARDPSDREGQLFVIFVPSETYNVQKDQNIWTLSLPCVTQGRPCHRVYSKNESDDHALVVTHSLLQSLFGLGQVGILSVDRYRWATDPNDPNYSIYHKYLDQIFTSRLVRTIRLRTYPIDYSSLYYNSITDKTEVIENTGTGQDFANSLVVVYPLPPPVDPEDIWTE